MGYIHLEMAPEEASQITASRASLAIHKPKPIPIDLLCQLWELPAFKTWWDGATETTEPVD